MAAEDRKQEGEEHKEELVTGFEVGMRVFLAKYGSYLLLTAAVALLGWQIWNYYQKKQEVAVQEAWYDLQAAQSSTDNEPGKLARVIADHDVKPVQGQAYLALGNFYLRTVALGVAPQGVPDAKYDRDGQLAQAEDAFRHAINGYADDMLIDGAARLGLAAVAEDRGNWDDARKEYEALIDPKSRFAGSAYATTAEARLGKLDDFRHAPRLAAGSAIDLPGSTGTRPAGALDNFGLPQMGPGFMMPVEPTGPAAPPGLPLDVTPPGAAPATGPAAAAPAGLIAPPPATAPAASLPH
jgi:tetratricopeptide (TPR) repeat protein